MAAEVSGRAWYAAHIGLLRAPTSEITVVYYVDPETKHLYAQPHPNTAAADMLDWGIAEPRAMLPFDVARDTARWIFKVSNKRLDAKSRRAHDDYAAWWRGYMASPKPFEPPIPLGIPENPSHVYRDQGWVDAKDWLRKPGKSSAVDESEEDDAEAA